MRRKFIVVISIIAILVISFLAMSYFTALKKTPETETPEEIARKVQALPVDYDRVSYTISSTGRLGSQSYVDIISEVQGEILPGNVPLKKGQRFRKGELLIRIYDEITDYNLKAAKSRFQNSIANILPDFKIDFPEDYQKIKDFFDLLKINEPLPELPVINSDQQRIFLASRNILNDYFSIKSSEIQLSKHRIFAPFNGTFTIVNLEVGSIASPGSRLARIINTSMLELEIPVAVSDVKWITKGDKVKVTSGDEAEEWTGTVVRKADYVDSQSQSVSVFISVQNNADHPLYEGQYLKAWFRGELTGQAMEIPRRAVFNSNEVFIVIDSTLKKAEINILKINQKSMIFNGLDEGVYVVVEPLVNASEGTMVEIY
ncbi:MAG: efflux RND transporter periplasmic adaptor subunit [Bacteroidetes bacterium]|nr:efflux RND transporter periplasmic adaptor subunit [Bacteroidota bacterium]